MGQSVASSPLHPHEPDIPPALDAEGRCLVCKILVERDELRWYDGTPFKRDPKTGRQL